METILEDLVASFYPLFPWPAAHYCPPVQAHCDVTAHEVLK